MFRVAAVLVSAIAAVSAGTWKEITTLSDIGLGIEFVSAEIGYTVGAYNGEMGQYLLKTTNGGKNWTSTEFTPNFGISLCLAVEKDNVFVNSLFDSYISPDGGSTWKNVTGLHAQGQGCRVENGEFFVAGTGLLWGNGVLHSKTGDFFEGKNITAMPANMFAQFGAYPSANAWYVSAGSFPQSDDDEQTQSKYSKVGEHGIFSGAILKSTDGGDNWDVLFSEQNSFDFNMIDCADDNTCCAVGSGAAIGNVHCSTDGKTFTEVWNSTTTTMMTIRSQGNGNWVATGNVVDGQAIYAAVLRSTDDGKTWTQDDLSTVPQTAVIDASFPTPEAGFILGIDRFNTLILLGYSA